MLPLGEFAIGTNTTAYVMARKFDIADKLPILIAEKTGPHFAVGDTCYSHEEDGITYNPDGKRIIARSNEISDLRKTNPDKAYFNCHTDITIPYDELGEVSAVTADGTGETGGKLQFRPFRLVQERHSRDAIGQFQRGLERFRQP